jgi:hypothetical protein
MRDLAASAVGWTAFSPSAAKTKPLLSCNTGAYFKPLVVAGEEFGNAVLAIAERVHPYTKLAFRVPSKSASSQALYIFLLT